MWVYLLISSQRNAILSSIDTRFLVASRNEWVVVIEKWSVRAKDGGVVLVAIDRCIERCNRMGSVEKRINCGKFDIGTDSKPSEVEGGPVPPHECDAEPQSEKCRYGRVMEGVIAMTE